MYITVICRSRGRTIRAARYLSVAASAAKGVATGTIETSRRLASVVAHPPTHVDLLGGQCDGGWTEIKSRRRWRRQTLWLWGYASTALCQPCVLSTTPFARAPSHSPSLSSQSPPILNPFSQGTDVFASREETRSGWRRGQRSKLATRSVPVLGF